MQKLCRQFSLLDTELNIADTEAVLQWYEVNN